MKDVAAAADDAPPGLASAIAPALFGPVRLAPGVRFGHALAFVLVAICGIGLIVFLNFMQPYLLRGQIHAAAGEVGRLTSWLSIMQELLVLACVGPLGALSDRVGRPPVFAFGLIVVATALWLYSLVSTVAELYAARLVFACGVAATTATLATVAADYPQNRDRGKFLGFLLVTQQIAILGLVANLAAKGPHWLVARGMDPVIAGQIVFRAAAVVGVMSALLAFFGLRRGASADLTSAPTLARTGAWASLVKVARHVRQAPRFAIVLAVAFVARGDAAIMSTFLSLWVVKSATAAGLSAAGGLAIAGTLLSAVTFSGMATALLIGWGADRVNRLAALAIALAMAGVGNVALLTVHDFGRWPVYALVGLIAAAETAVIICGQAVLGEQAHPDLRGAAVGAFSMFGSLGVLILVFFGGLLFDRISGQAPFVMIGAVNLLAGAAAAVVWLKPDLLQTGEAAASPGVSSIR